MRPTAAPTNLLVAEIFRKIAALLEAQGASTFRVKAWRDGAEAIRRHPISLADLFRERGREGIDEIPHIGRGLAAVAIEILRTGRARALDRLEGELSPVDVFADLPGIGEGLANRIHEGLGIDSLEDLEQAAHDGRLAALPGFGPKRLEAVRDVLAARLSRREGTGPGATAVARRPSVGLLLEEDARYRKAAAAGQLPQIAPRRFNPTGEAWLPILHEDRQGWHFTVMYSNTARAHQLGRTHDWVVIYHQRSGEALEGRATVVTETRGAQRGERVVRGREHEDRPPTAQSFPAAAGAAQTDRAPPSRAGHA
jgi:hypothetical protein